MFTSCFSSKQIADLNIVSVRNIDSNAEYTRLTTYSGGTKRELKKSRAESVNDAIAQTLRKVDGGEYLMNAKIYIVQHFAKQYFAVEGDVWGISSNEWRGFKIGDAVTYTYGGVYYNGTVIGFKKQKNEMIIRPDKAKVTIDVKAENVYKSTKIDEK